MKELWKHCKTFTGYQASNIGRVKKNGRILKPTKDKYRYLRLHLRIDKKSIMKRVHQLVADAWIENPNGEKYLNHINGDKSDNRVENLEWCSFADNMKHGHANGLFDAVKGENCHLSVVTETDVLDIRNTYNLGCVTQQEIADAWNISRTAVGSIVREQTWKHL